MLEAIRFVQERTPASRVVFGRGRIAELPSEVAALGRRPFLLASRRSAQLVEEFAGNACAHFDQIRQHVPRDLGSRATVAFAAARADVIVTVGGGSSTGFGKVVARETGAPLVCVPTTYSGSERTDIWGQTHDGIKTTGHDPMVVPRTVLYDPELLWLLPRHIAAPSVMNALAHSVEALWLPADPLLRLTAAQGVVAMATGLRELAVRGHDGAGDQLLYGAFLSGTALGGAGTGFHHEIAHILGGRFDLPHAELHACLLPFTTLLAGRIGLDLSELEGAAARVTAPASSAAALMYELATVAIGAPSLAALGLRRDQLDLVRPAVARVHDPAGRPLGTAAASWLLDSAYEVTIG